jgi:hypothetical protein
MFTVYCLLFTVYCLLFTVYCLLFTTRSVSKFNVQNNKDIHINPHPFHNPTHLEMSDGIRPWICPQFRPTPRLSLLCSTCHHGKHEHSRSALDSAVNQAREVSRNAAEAFGYRRSVNTKWDARVALDQQRVDSFPSPSAWKPALNGVLVFGHHRVRITRDGTPTPRISASNVSDAQWDAMKSIPGCTLRQGTATFRFVNPDRFFQWFSIVDPGLDPGLCTAIVAFSESLDG